MSFLLESDLSWNCKTVIISVNGGEISFLDQQPGQNKLTEVISWLIMCKPGKSTVQSIKAWKKEG